MREALKRRVVTAVVVVVAITFAWIVVFGVTSWTTTGPFERGSASSEQPVPTIEFGPLNEIQIVETGETAVAEPVLEETPGP